MIHKIPMTNELIEGIPQNEEELADSFVLSYEPKGYTKQNSEKLQRDIADLIQQGLSRQDISTKLTVDIKTVKYYWTKLHNIWRGARNEDLGVWQSKELQFAIEQRAVAVKENRTKWTNTTSGTILKWSTRIAELLGLDAPKINVDWTKEDWDTYAKERGVSEEQIVETFIRDTVEKIGTGSLKLNLDVLKQLIEAVAPTVGSSKDNGSGLSSDSNESPDSTELHSEVIEAEQPQES